MANVMFSQLTAIDGLAVCWFAVCWIGYAYLSEGCAFSRRGLVAVSHEHRLLWARRMLEREMRIADVSVVGNLMSSVSFYANTTIYIIAGLFAIFGTLDKLQSFAADLPFARTGGRDLMELKLLVLIGAFIFAYFKFTWALRQLNLLSILIGAAPFGRADESPASERYAVKVAKVSSFAGDEFNRGIRAYYFGLAAVCWLIGPVIFLAVTTVVVGVLYRRDFASQTLAALRE